MRELKEQEERSEGTHQAKRRTAIGYDDMTKFMEHLQKPETVETDGLGRCLLFQAVTATAFTLWLTYVLCRLFCSAYVQSTIFDINNFFFFWHLKI